MANPPFSHQQRGIGQQQNAANAAAVPPPNPFIGGWQPLAPRKLNPLLLSVDPPQFAHRMRDERFQQVLLRMWDPDPRLAYQFFGAKQPFEQGKLPPILLDIDNPPAYNWELVALEPEDPTIYFRAQRYPSQKTIVSIDSPPTQDDGRVDILSHIIATWNIPGPPPTLVSRTKLPQGTSSATGDVLSAGVGTVTWVGTSAQNTAPKSAFQMHVVRAWDVPASIPQRGKQYIQAVAASQAADWSSAGTGAAAWIGASVSAPAGYIWEMVTVEAEDPTLYARLQPRYKLTAGAASPNAAMSSVGTGTATWQGTFTQPQVPRNVLQAHIVRAWDPPIVVTFELPQVSISAANADLNSVGVGTASFVGSSAQNTAVRARLQNQILASWQPIAPIRQPLRFFPQAFVASATGNIFSPGTGTATFRSTSTVTSALAAAGVATVNFRGHADHTGQVRYDGWRPRREQFERRKRKDEQEIMEILAAVLPIIQSGTVREPTRISVPRNGGTTLQ